ncbi:MAG: putative quinol monooxygenase [Desulfobacteraceae bacterium]|jgi:quinol monooxygenase YgiN
MIIVRITMTVFSEKRLEMLQTLRSMIELTEKERGCLNYAVLYDIKDKNRFSLIEEWEGREDLDGHIASQRFGVLLGTKALLSKPMEIQIHTVSRSEGMEAVSAVRREERATKIRHRQFMPFLPRK